MYTLPLPHKTQSRSSFIFSGEGTFLEVVVHNSCKSPFFVLLLLKNVFNTRDSERERERRATATSVPKRYKRTIRANRMPGLFFLSPFRRPISMDGEHNSSG